MSVAYLGGRLTCAVAGQVDWLVRPQFYESTQRNRCREQKGNHSRRKSVGSEFARKLQLPTPQTARLEQLLDTDKSLFARLPVGFPLVLSILLM